MINDSFHIMEKNTAAAFDKQAAVFDRLYGTDTLISYKRDCVREHLARFLRPGSRILELNAGTGEDACWLAGQGVSVHATDISPVMLGKLREKINVRQLAGLIRAECCSFTALENLEEKGPFDHIFSNFGGLNCTNRLEKVLDRFEELLKPGGYATLVLLPKFCLWETAMLFRGKFKTAFRRFSGAAGTPAHIEGHHFHCWYYNPSFIRDYLKGSFDVVALEGLCTLVPPSWYEGFAEKYPRFYRFLVRKEKKWKSLRPWRSTGDYYMITLQKRSFSSGG